MRDLGPPAKTIAGCRRTRQRAARYLVPPLIGHRPRVPCVTRWLATTPKINARVRAAPGPGRWTDRGRPPGVGRRQGRATVQGVGRVTAVSNACALEDAAGEIGRRVGSCDGSGTGRVRRSAGDSTTAPGSQFGRGAAGTRILPRVVAAELSPDPGDRPAEPRSGRRSVRRRGSRKRRPRRVESGAWISQPGGRSRCESRRVRLPRTRPAARPAQCRSRPSTPSTPQPGAAPPPELSPAVAPIES